MRTRGPTRRAWEATNVQASGYAANTPRHATIEVGDSDLIELDPERCRDRTCRPPNGSPEVPEERCLPRSLIEIAFETTLWTEDESIRARGTGTVNSRVDELSLEFRAGGFSADPTTIEGTLTLSEPEADGANDGTLRVSFVLGAKVTEGSLSMKLTTLPESEIIAPITGSTILQSEVTDRSTARFGKWPVGEQLQVAPMRALEAN